MYTLTFQYTLPAHLSYRNHSQQASVVLLVDKFDDDKFQIEVLHSSPKEFVFKQHVNMNEVRKDLHTHAFAAVLKHERILELDAICFLK